MAWNCFRLRSVVSRCFAENFLVAFLGFALGGAIPLRARQWEGQRRVPAAADGRAEAALTLAVRGCPVRLYPCELCSVSDGCESIILLNR
jgi:hypothetical protein